LPAARTGAILVPINYRLAHFKARKKVFFTSHLPQTGSAKIYKYRLRKEYKTK